ncbi:MAG: hypothetical protein JXR27_12360 [Paludibacteraceae bacterium]|nr:hypothetical protein [Paludibacteraceae bacterium]
MSPFKIRIVSRFIILASVVALASCSSMMFTSVDILKPALITFNPEDTRLLIVNNSVTQPVDYGHRTQYFNEKPYLVNVNTDSLSLFAIESLAESLATKDFFSTITIHDQRINNSAYFFSITHLPFDTVNALCDRYDSDVILSLDRIKVIDKIDEYYLNDEYAYYTTLEARYETRWSVYVPEKTTFQAITLHDTVYWDARSAQRKRGISFLPDRYNALIDGALYAGKSAVNKFIPYWTKADRYFFSDGNKSMKAAMDSVSVRNWKGAIDVWQKIVEAKSGTSLKARASHNIAVAYEILGDLNNAVLSIENAVGYVESSMTASSKITITIAGYFDELQKRKNEIQMLEKQLGD